MRVLDKEIRVRGRLVRVGRIDGEFYVDVNDPAPMVDDLRKARSGIDLFTFVQSLPHTEPRFNYAMEWENLAVVKVSTFDQWWNEQLGYKARNKAKQAEKKGVVLKEVPFDDTLVRGIWQIYNECPIRHGKKFPHYGKDIDTVREMTATFLDRSVLIGAFFEDRLIGFIKLTSNESRSQAGLMHILSMIEHRDKAPTNALIARAVRACADRGIPHLFYANFGYGKKQKDSLTDFKERNGFQRVDLPRYYVPLTSIGHLALNLNLHRSIKERIPESIAAKLREWRASWNARKDPSARLV